MGPVVGVIAAAQVDLALALLDGERVTGQLVTFPTVKTETVAAPVDRRASRIVRCAGSESAPDRRRREVNAHAPA